MTDAEAGSRSESPKLGNCIAAWHRDGPHEYREGCMEWSPIREVEHLVNYKAARFLRSLQDCPFLCIVVDDDRVRLYEKDMPADALEDLLTALERTIPEHADDDVSTES